MSGIYDKLNDKQKQAVFTTEGPVLLLAGAGSGKTGVLMHRIAYLIEEKHIDPYNIMAITFTNKAAKEMKERIGKLIGEEGNFVWVMTFHSSCVRFLRRFIDRIGFDNSFTIYDSDDQRTLMKKIFKEYDINSKVYKERAVLNAISNCKNELMSPSEYMKSAIDSYEKGLARLYELYQSALKKNNALDFDDLICRSVELFEKCPEVLDYYQNRFRYIMVDEYQDTNTAQFRLIYLLAQKYKNICVVGDDDQSIYKFRGANIENILSFEERLENVNLIKLEQNYRSTGNILDAANAVIKNNRGRKDKRLWTEGESGENIELRQFQTANEEADNIIKDIKNRARENFRDFAVLYRTNAQSRLLEERCVTLGVPYQLIGGVNFYQRKEIKDVLAYLKTIANGNDDIALLRIINVPKRGIGATTIAKVVDYANANDISLYDAMSISENAGVGKASEKIKSFIDMIEYFREKIDKKANISSIIDELLDKTGYIESLYDEGEIEGESRKENIEELINKSTEYEDGELSLFLEEVSLVADIDRMDENADRITLMTLHGAKGLEFDTVYLAGMEEGLFPSAMSANSKEDLEEERRLAYVGITRAKKNLILTSAKQRMINGETRYSLMSRFVNEIPKELLNKHVLDTEKRYTERSSSFGEGLPWETKTPINNNNFEKTLSFGKQFKVEKAKSLDYNIGDTVKHIKFGTGKVLEIVDGEKDFEVKVNFDKFGIKKMYAGFAKLVKI
ncbi:MAG: ATP-dependent DNA helicase PcrA [Lachnospiraceae bacterium]|nr:MAG: ATP-dependent DNA helicase PcrA [Lachnospiraceae bacterium]